MLLKLATEPDWDKYNLEHEKTKQIQTYWQQTGTDIAGPITPIPGASDITVSESIETPLTAMLDPANPTVRTYGYFELGLIQDSFYNHELFYDVYLLANRE